VTFKGVRIGVRYDFYQVGLLVLEMASGPLPYGELPTYSIEEMARRLDRGQRAILPRHLVPAPWVPPVVRRVVRKAISMNPEQRYPSARAMVDALRKAPFVDWTLVQNDADQKVWEGTTARAGQRRFRVEASLSTKRGIWTISGLQKINAWRRAGPDVVATQLTDAVVVARFDEMVAIANNT
jgi:hypothetical protein